MSFQLRWDVWSPDQDWWKQVLDDSSPNNYLWIQLQGSDLEGGLTEGEMRQIYAQWFLGQGWATPPMELESGSTKPFWVHRLRWKPGKEKFTPDEPEWMQLEGEEAIRRIWMEQGDWLSTRLPNPDNCPFPGYEVHHVQREQVIPENKHADYPVIAHMWRDEEVLDKPTKEKMSDIEWNWIESNDYQVEFIQEFVLPFHTHPKIDLILREVREGTPSEFWQHNRKAPFLEQTPRRECWIRIQWKLDGFRGRRNQNAVFEWNKETILDDITTWITALLQDLMSSIVLYPKSSLKMVMDDFTSWQKENGLIAQNRPALDLTRDWFHSHNALDGWIAQDNILGDRGYIWVSRVPGQQEMVWWIGTDRTVPLGWLAEGWAGTIMEGILVGEQQSIYLVDCLAWKGMDIRGVSFQGVQVKENRRIEVKSRWFAVELLVKEANKRGSSWKAMEGLNTEWRMQIRKIPMIGQPNDAWNALPDEDKENKDMWTWFVGTWIRNVDNGAGTPAGLAAGPLTAGQRKGIQWRNINGTYADRQVVQWSFPSQHRVTTRILKVGQVEQTELLNQGGVTRYIPYQKVQIQIRTTGEGEIGWKSWRPELPPADGFVDSGKNPGANQVFEVGIPVIQGTMSTFVAGSPWERGELIRDGDLIQWELAGWPDLDPAVFPWRPISRIPRGRNVDDERHVATATEIQSAWDAFRAPITPDIWKSGKMPLGEPLPIPLPGDNEVSEGRVMGPDYEMKTEGDREEAVERIEESKTLSASDAYYVKEADASAKLPFMYFHNQVVKWELYRLVAPAWADLRTTERELLKIRQPPRVNPDGFLVELASGRAADAYKWQDARFKTLVGLEYSEPNIDLSYQRMADVRGFKPDYTFLWADCAKTIFPEYQAAMDGDSRKRMTEVLPSKYMADVVSCQFAIHYFFKDELSLRGFMLNVADCLKVGGMFIATTFDGERVNAALKGIRGGEIQGYRTGETGAEELLFRIKRNYQPAKWKPEGDNLGLMIDVMVGTIGQSIPEYLVYNRTLEKYAKEVGLEIVKLEGFETIWNRVPHTIRRYDEVQSMSPAEKTFSFLNEAIIMKKVKQTPDSAYAEYQKLLKKMEKKSGSKVKTSSDVSAEMEGGDENTPSDVKEITLTASATRNQEFEPEQELRNKKKNKKWISELQTGSPIHVEIHKE